MTADDDHQKLVAEAKALDNRNDDQRQAWRIAHDAAQTAQTCGRCGRKLKPDAPVWRDRVPTSGFFGRSGSTVTPICQKCHDREEKRNREFERKYDFPRRREEYEKAKPCEGCGRPVHDISDMVNREHTACSELCRRKVLSAVGAAAARQRRAATRAPRACEGCDKVFTPRRADARFCGDPCKQRAYRRRVTASKKGGGARIAKRNAQRRVTARKKLGAGRIEKRNG
jgi:hypothetical protein